MGEEEEMRKGPWTEQEDVQLVFYVNLFGDRRWDFIAKVSGLKRTGKSCRLRWVNYLHPGLKRGKMTPAEERLVLDLHSKWGNRWSRIARKLPGRTDNEIKNYWRTHMRKKAQEKKRVASPSSSLSNFTPSSSSSNSTATHDHMDSKPATENKEISFYDTGGFKMKAVDEGGITENTGCNLDEIWKDIDLFEDTIKPAYDPYHADGLVASPVWDQNLDSLWIMDAPDQNEAANKVFFPTSNQFSAFLTG